LKNQSRARLATKCRHLVPVKSGFYKTRAHLPLKSASLSRCQQSRQGLNQAHAQAFSPQGPHAFLQLIAALMKL
jgi:hypothetical protein